LNDNRLTQLVDAAARGEAGSAGQALPLVNKEWRKLALLLLFLPPIVSAQDCEIILDRYEDQMRYCTKLIKEIEHYRERGPQDVIAAINGLRKAAEAGDAEAQYQMSRLHLNSCGLYHDEAEYVNWLQLAAKQGHIGAQTTLGQAYRTGHCVPQDYAQAARWLRLAAEQGEPNARSKLVEMYRQGQGVQLEDLKSSVWSGYLESKSSSDDGDQAKPETREQFENPRPNESHRPGSEAAAAKLIDLKARAQRGDADAQIELGLIYVNGECVAESGANAVIWLQKAADQGDVRAMKLLARLYGHDISLQVRPKGLPKDSSKEKQWWQKAADKGDVDAMFHLGVWYDGGYSTPIDVAEAIQWWRRAADLGNIDSMNRLAYLYYEGNEVSQDIPEAIRWWLKAAEMGDFESMDSLARLYYFGRTVPEDIPEAIKWWSKAADQGDVESMNWLADLYYEGKVVPKDINQAIKWWRKAAKTLDPSAMYDLADYYYNGPEKLRDLSEIYFLYGCGQRANYAYYECDLVAKELSPAALIAARQRAAEIWSKTPGPEPKAECSFQN
jgi:TPR repeat protein